MTTLTPRFLRGLTVAQDLHVLQTRKSSGIPYISHLMSVAALAMEMGADEDTVIACLLHDAIEDHDTHPDPTWTGEKARGLIRKEFGSRVLSIVEECTETDANPKPAWRTRKDEYIAHMLGMSEEAWIVALCDKLHNARCTLLDVIEQGDAAWDIFNAGKAEQEWWYRSLEAAFSHRPSPMQREFSRVVDALFAA